MLGRAEGPRQDPPARAPPHAPAEGRRRTWLDREPAPNATPEHWLVWQSPPTPAQPALLPTDPGRLVDALGVRKAKGGDLVAAAIGQLMAKLYESRAV